MASNISPIMTAVFDSRRDDVSPLMLASINNYDDKLSSAIAAIIDIYNKYINPRRYVELPEDLWIQILIRLPVKSLSLAMSVCKHWAILIKDPSFTRKHLQLQKTASNSSGHFLLYHDDQIDDAFNYFLFDGESVTNAIKLSLSLPLYHNIFHFPRGDMYYPFEINGPINGLYCLHNQEGRIVIWNPATNEAGFLPLPGDYYGKERYLYDGIIGFGIDPLDEENYKVILISSCCYTANNYETAYTMLYTTRTNTWRHLKDVYRVVESLNNTCLNGSYYWMLDRMCTVIVFDMRKEAFRSISTPCHGNIALHNSHITLFDTNENLNEIDIWVMLEESNWLKLKKVCVRGIQGHVVKTLGFWKTENDLLIVIDDSNCRLDTQTILYNTSTRGITNLGPRGDYDGFKACMYYESLVSLSGEIIKYKGNDNGSLMEMVCDFFLEDSIDNEDSTDDEESSL